MDTKTKFPKELQQVRTDLDKTKKLVGKCQDMRIKDGIKVSEDIDRMRKTLERYKPQFGKTEEYRNITIDIGSLSRDLGRCFCRTICIRIC